MQKVNTHDIINLELVLKWKSELECHQAHLPDETRPLEVVGIGLNSEELAANSTLTERQVHDLNKDPTLPFSDARVDAVI